MASMWSGLNKAKNQLTRTYFGKGRYKVRLNLVKGISAADSWHQVKTFVVETTVLESNTAVLSPGIVASWVQKCGGETPIEVAYGAIKHFFAAVLDCKVEKRLIDGEKVDCLIGDDGKIIDVEEMCDLATSAANPLEGIVLGLNCYEKMLKPKPGKRDAPKPFTIHEWHVASRFSVQA